MKTILACLGETFGYEKQTGEYYSSIAREGDVRAVRSKIPEAAWKAYSDGISRRIIQMQVPVNKGLYPTGSICAGEDVFKWNIPEGIFITTIDFTGRRGEYKHGSWMLGATAFYSGINQAMLLRIASRLTKGEQE